MLLVADSGATKTAWLLTDDEGYPHEYSTMGFSPLFHSEQDILVALGGNAALCEVAPKVSRLCYFGAGCSSEDRNEKMRRAFAHFFANAAIRVEHDLLASVLATCGNEVGISCILGTGSNACFSDGHQLHEGVPSLDYILGDEGSGAYFGKKLVADFLYKRFPAPLHAAFEEAYHLDKEQVLNRVYRQPHPKVWLAAFTRFLETHINNDYVHTLLLSGIGEFLDIRVCIFDNHREVPVHFVGSIAYHFQDVLREACNARSLQIGKIIKQPIYELNDYIRAN